MELFKDLTQLYGPSGYERQVRAFIKEKVSDYADEMMVDALGNLIVLKKGYGDNKKKIMMAAHMDEIALQVIKVEENGTLMVKALGSCWLYTTYHSRVQFKNGVIGVVGSRVPADKIDGKFVNFFVDIGLSSKEETLKYVDVGDVAVFMGPYEEMLGNNIMAKAVDDRVGCYMLMETLMQGKNYYNDIYYVFSVQEEVGCYGATGASERIKPDIGVAVDVTPSHDRPGMQEGSNTLGAGTAIKISDMCSISDEYLVETMINICKRDGIKFQKEVIYVGGTDASAISISNYGVKSCALSVVTRNVHGPHGIINKEDIENSIKLLKAFADTEFIFEE